MATANAPARRVRRFGVADSRQERLHENVDDFDRCGRICIGARRYRRRAGNERRKDVERTTQRTGRHAERQHVGGCRRGFVRARAIVERERPRAVRAHERTRSWRVPEGARWSIWQGRERNRHSERNRRRDWKPFQQQPRKMSVGHSLTRNDASVRLPSNRTLHIMDRLQRRACERKKLDAARRGPYGEDDHGRNDCEV